MSSYFSIELGSHKHFLRGWPRIGILLISASQVARITDVSHWCLANFHKFLK
jgi:hypothetical protein